VPIDRHSQPALDRREPDRLLQPAPDRQQAAEALLAVPGPHKSHKPHEVTQNVNVVPWTDAYGKVHDTREFKVMHPGTLVKSTEPVSMVRKVIEGVAQL
jgi:hypothetical protein